MSETPKGVQLYKSPFHAAGYSEAEANALVRKADLAIAIEDAIAALGITQKDAAERADVTPTQINEIVRGRIKSYSIDRLIRILEALGQEVNIIVTARAADDEPQAVA